VLLFNLLQSADILGNAAKTLQTGAWVGIEVNRERCLTMVETNIGVVTALVPYLTYQIATGVAKEAQATGKTVRSIVLERGLLSEQQLDHVLSLNHLTRPSGIDG